MSVSYTTTQIASVDANAGLTQNISVGTQPSPDYFAGNLPAGQNGPGWATTTGGATTKAATASATSWAIYAIMAALLYLSVKWGGK